MNITITTTSVLVDDQARALDSYTNTLGLVQKTDMSASDFGWLTAPGIRFTQVPITMGPVTTAVLDDTCGNLIQIASMP